MTVTEKAEINGKMFAHTYSDRKLMIRRDGTDEIYLEAYDVLNFTYEETDTQIDAPEDGK